MAATLIRDGTDWACELADVFHCDDAAAIPMTGTLLNGALTYAAADVSAAAGGLSAQMFRVGLQRNPGGDACSGSDLPSSVMVKRTKPTKGARDMAGAMGLGREAHLYHALLPATTAPVEGSSNGVAHVAARLRDAVIDHLCAPQPYAIILDTVGHGRVQVLQDLAAPLIGAESAPIQVHQAGHFLDARSPLNATVDVAAKRKWLWDNVALDQGDTAHTAASAPIDDAAIDLAVQRAITADAFRRAAALHGAFWCDKTLLARDPEAVTAKSTADSLSWLRARDLLQYASAESSDTTAAVKAAAAFDGLIGYSRNAWLGDAAARGRAHWTDKFDQRLIRLIDHALDPAVATLHDYCSGVLEAATWTLVHGDFHPGNWLLLAQGESQESKDKKCAFRQSAVDYEMVGVGCGPQELGQYMISHITPACRRAFETDALKEYYAALQEAHSRATIANGGEFSKLPPFDAIVQAYALGGVKKWLWFMPFLCTNAALSDAQVMYFHDQVLAFAADHGLADDPARVGAART